MKRVIGQMLLVAVMLLYCRVSEAQPAKKIPLIGILTPDPVSARANAFEAFRQGLRDLGYVEGTNIAIEFRSAEGNRDRLPTLASELVTLKVDVIVTSTTPAIKAAKQATQTIPIVTVSADPVGSGLVVSLARPGGNITGLSLLGPEIGGKQLELLKETLPKVKRVAYVRDPSNTAATLQLNEVKIAAQAMGLQIQSLDVRSPNELKNVLKSGTSERAGALIVPTTMGNAYRGQIVDFATKNRLPVMYAEGESVEMGGLMSYGANILDLFRRAATYVDKILKGAKPADLPVEQPTKFEFVINLKAAKQIGLAITPRVIERAKQVIK